MPTVESYFDKGVMLHVEQETIDRQAEAYERIATEAERAGLINAGHAGVLVLVHPRTQIDEGIYHRVQVATGNKDRCINTHSEDCDKAND